MPHSTQRSVLSTHPTLWIPQDFHPEDTLPAKLRIYAQQACYVMHCVVTRIAFGRKDFARLNNKILRNIIGNRHCEAIIQALLENGELQRVGGYVVGQHSYGYYPAEKFIIQHLRRFVPTDPYLLDRLAAARQQAMAMHQQRRQPIHDFWENAQRVLRIDWEEACEVLQKLPISSNPFGVQAMLAERIHNGQFRLSVDPYGRVHNSITNLHRQLRQALRIKGSSLAHVDIVNSQPALLGAFLLKQELDRRTGSGGRRKTGGGGGAAGGGQPSNSTIYDAAPFSSIEGGEHYEQLATNGRLYEYLMAKTGLSRAAVKKRLLCDVFGKCGNYPSELEQAFLESFPGVYCFIRSYIANDHAALLRELQRIESDFVIHRVGVRLKELRCTGCISLHDAVYCARHDIDTVERAFRDEMKAMGVQMKLEVAA